MNVSRRKFLQSLFVGFALTTTRGWANKSPVKATERRDFFPQGVASGDPTADSVILWTRRPPVNNSTAKKLIVEISTTADFKKIHAGGTANLNAESDWTCRFLVTDLKPNREYWYRFVDDQGFASRTGRTITAPAKDSNEPVRFTFVSCQCPNEGALNAYRRMIYDDEHRPKDQQLDFVLHLGDFIYEVTWYAEDNPNGNRGRKIKNLYKFPQGRKVGNFHLPVTLEDYRTLYRAYLEDPDLQDARARWPFVCVWDNHEFAWAGYQSQYVAGGAYNAPAQNQKVFANQAWWEFIPARVQQPGNPKLENFNAPAVVDTVMEEFNEDGLSEEPNNLLAINSLKIQRVLHWGKNVDLLLTDNWSFRSPDMSTGDFFVPGFPRVYPQTPYEIMDYGRHYNNDNPPDMIRFNGKDYPNPTKDLHANTFLGKEQRKWFLEQLGASAARWKIWGHTFGSMELRSDYHNLPDELGSKWPKDSGYTMLDMRFLRDKDEIFNFVKAQKITGFCAVAGDRHSFYAGLTSKALPPKEYEPLGVEFITGSISQQTPFEVMEVTLPKTHPLRTLYLIDKPDGGTIPSMNVSAMHGVTAALKLQETGDMEQARTARNPDVAPHLSFLDLGGHGYGLVTATPDELSTEFVCIPRPLERSEREDGGPLRYRVVHRTRLWKAGETPKLEQQILEGDAKYCI
ncbi:MAG TPA: alkaline phosphatase D family protein [Cyclobacteriaceae bacterium]|nr:alkaline phosphatase D family protein [Cyclobacteriaceae bacterium]HMV07339.1 alkaline phosphatase D family protein [Cyclobacteriaceae bacterium]HMV88817.1 alkaline phosphatase D family protein [Cyclobacteriaceae bacterium]HMW99306.1 alkaline phosphatase D family protein [Cyclobacteriaceae bacterium]HMX48905.1 alkaline phosphatase D family protein [Cyclobacteriaceae bacterium]